MPNMNNFLHQNHQSGLNLTLLNVLNVLNVLNMPKDESLACWDFLNSIILSFWAANPKAPKALRAPQESLKQPQKPPRGHEPRKPHGALKDFRELMSVSWSL